MLCNKCATEMCVLCVLFITDYFVQQGDPGGRGAPGDLGTRGEMVGCCS